MTTQATIATIVYPETDGMPLPDGEYQSPIFRRVLVPLEGYFRDVPGAHVNGNTILYYVEGSPHRSVSPDCYVVFGLSEAAIHSLSLEGNNTYLLWEVGKPPEFALEIASGSTARTDLGRKRELYAELGISEYWRYDASGETSMARRWWESVWWTASIGDWRRISRMKGECGGTAPH